MDSERHKIFVIDDDATFCLLLDKILSRDYDVATFTSPLEAIKRIDAEKPDLILTDYTMPDMNGLELTRFVKENYPQLPVLVLTGYGSIESAVEVLKAGAFDYMEKSISGGASTANFTVLRSRINNAIAQARVKRESERYKSENERLKRRFKQFRSTELIGKSDAIERVRRLIEQIAKTDSTVLILGETGTGKNVAAELIHRQSARASKGEFVEINCAVLPDNLLEAELFGYEKGAFTDAKETKKGLFEIANNGTIFLDEIDSTSPVVQSKLLTVLETRSFRRIGGTEPISVNVRLVCATNASLAEKVQQGKFREDLFFRINVVSFAMPPLRSLGDDIILIAEMFVRQFSEEMQKNVLGLSDDAKALLLAHHWKGNVRELRNVMERAVVFAENGGRVTANEISFGDVAQIAAPSQRLDAATRVAEKAFSIPMGKTLEEVKLAYIKAVLDDCQNRYAEAAKILDIAPKTLWEIRKRHNLEGDMKSAP
ncbi:MAG: sigma-54 dependent transcriptional regulator [Chloroherpetonaceae bacterium]|nr:sigma-54 dependent transcriptional regulator [Chloroherpetonaceae bacterium]MDW8437265.1 sigma-54 dependent transcriptional regulator [Chloroherpetonaceae bacterium]